MPTADDYDPVQDAKAAREAAVVAEIEDTPGSRVTLPPIPTERLDETDAFRSANRRAQRLHMAFDLFRSLVSGCWREAIGPGNSTGKIRSWCWDQADAFLGEGDKPTPVLAAAVAPAPAGRRSEDDIPPTDFRLQYLQWLAAPHRGGSCGEHERPPAMLASMADAVRVRLEQQGLIAATWASGVVGSVAGGLAKTTYSLTAAGWAKVTAMDGDEDTVDYTPPPGDLELQQPAERVA